MVHLRQSSHFDCGVAALAMVTRLSPGEVRERLGYAPEDTQPSAAFGVLEDECALLLHQLGRMPLTLWTRELHRYEGVHAPPVSPRRAVMNTLNQRKLILSSVEVMAMARGHEALFTAVQPMQLVGHIVAFNGTRVLDPAPQDVFRSDNFGQWHMHVAIIAQA